MTHSVTHQLTQIFHNPELRSVALAERIAALGTRVEDSSDVTNMRSALFSSVPTTNSYPVVYVNNKTHQTDVSTHKTDGPLPVELS